MLISGKPGSSANDAGSKRSGDRKSTRLNSSHLVSSYAVFCLKKKAGTLDFSAALDASCKAISQIRLSVKLSVKMLKTVFFFNDTATTEISTLSLHDALPI